MVLGPQSLVHLLIFPSGFIQAKCFSVFSFLLPQLPVVLNAVSTKFWFGSSLSTYYMPGIASCSLFELSPKPREEQSAHLIIQPQLEKYLQLRGVKKVAQNHTVAKW